MLFKIFNWLLFDKTELKFNFTNVKLQINKYYVTYKPIEGRCEYG